ncbi:MAG: YggS family pyridoxal phosphate-dependent enzyme [Bacteroidetes bacterium]|nr:YggS family pyridoxal phosphate-dependent enzyme [Bacteroidota bacterium]
MGIRENLLSFLDTIPKSVQLVAVSKTKPNEAIKEAYDAGQRIFGENKVQDLVAKVPELPKDINWHFIGHMQTNKVKLIAPFISMIHAVDSIKLLEEINKQALKNNRTIECLLQFHIATESTKFGLNFEEATQILNNPVFYNLNNIKIVGVMGMGTYTDDTLQIKNEFKQLVNYFNLLKDNFFKDKVSFKEISMGMSGDYKIAIDEGSTMIRIGTKIFGERNY